MTIVECHTNSGLPVVICEEINFYLNKYYFGSLS